jgi:hypothetical protein
MCAAVCGCSDYPGPCYDSIEVGQHFEVHIVEHLDATEGGSTGSPCGEALDFWEGDVLELEVLAIGAERGCGEARARIEVPERETVRTSTTTPGGGGLFSSSQLLRIGDCVGNWSVHAAVVAPNEDPFATVEAGEKVKVKMLRTWNCLGTACTDAFSINFRRK